MENFIALSQSSKKALQILQMSAALPVNILITGEAYVGKRLLAQTVFSEAAVFEAEKLYELIVQNKIEIAKHKEIIVLNIDTLSNKMQFLEMLQPIKVVATSAKEYSDSKNYFAVKIPLKPLSKRKEDLEMLVKKYTAEANTLYQSEVDSQDVLRDTSLNALSLKRGVYKSVFLHSMDEDDIQNALYNFFINYLQKKNYNYKDFLKVFEIPLLKATKQLYKSQVQIAKVLDINRITLRKKIANYFGENNEL